MRGLVLKLETPHPLGSSLPGIYQQDTFAQRLTSAFDDALAPIFSTLDNFDAYLDPLLAPEDSNKQKLIGPCQKKELSYDSCVLNFRGPLL